METIETLGKYEIRGTLGKGAMGTVYEGWDPIIARRVAIKTVRIPDSGGDDPETEEALARFRREAQAAGRLIHPNIVGVFDYGETGEIAYIVMEYVDGPSVKSLLDKREQFELAAAVRIMTDLLTGLQFSHGRGVVHRDIKPANIMLTSEGQAKIADFGIARIESSSMTQAGTVLGTPAYMSPEQFMGQVVDARTDLYSAGVVLYQLLTGERPFEGGMSAIMHKALHTDPPLPSHISVTAPAAFDSVVRKAMAKRPEHRFQAAAEFLEAVQAASVGKALPGFEAEDTGAEATMVAAPARPVTTAPPVVAEPARTAPQAAPPATPGASRKRLSGPLLAGVSLVALSLLAGGAWFFLLRGPAPKPAQLATTAPASPAPAASGAAAATAEAGTAPAAQAAPGKAVGASPPSSQAGGSGPAQATPPQPSASQPTPGTAAAAAASGGVASGAAAGTNASSSAEPPQAGAGSGPAPAAAPVPQQTAAVGLGSVEAQVRQLVARHSCALIDGATSDAGSLTLDGMAGLQAANAIQSSLGRLNLTDTVSWQVQGVAPIFCPALDTLHPIVPAFGAPGPRLGLMLAGGDTRLRDGARIMPRLTMPRFAANLVVDYVAHDGTLLHLYPQVADPKDGLAADAPRTFSPGQVVTLGSPRAGHPAWEVGPPYGTDMIIAIASSQPLFAHPRPSDSESAATYLAALRTAVEAAQAKGEQVAGAALLVDTLPK